jgi:hypothetical protein
VAELVLTDAEKCAELWSDLDDQSLGALMRKKLVGLKSAAEQMDRAVTMAAALLLCCSAAEAGASELSLSIDGVTQAGRDFGDWQVVVRKR